MSAVYKYQLFTNSSCLQTSAVFKYQLFTHTSCLQISAVYKYQLFTSISCLQISAVYKYQLFRDLPAIVFYSLIGNDVCTNAADPNRYVRSHTCNQIPNIVTWSQSCYPIQIMWYLIPNMLQIPNHVIYLHPKPLIWSQICYLIPAPGYLIPSYPYKVYPIQHGPG